MRRPFVFILLYLAAYSSIEPAIAQHQRRVALVIGNAAYRQSPLVSPANDARAFATQLQRLGFEVIALTDAARAEMLIAMREFERRLDGDSTALLYFAGHGIQIRGTNYILPVDASLNTEADVVDDGIDLDSLMRALPQKHKGPNLVFVDASRFLNVRLGPRPVERGLAPVGDLPENTLLVTAARPGTVASDGNGANSPFATSLMKSLDAPGVSAFAAAARAANEVSTLTGGSQRPLIMSSLTDEIELTPATSSAPAAPDAAAQAALARARAEAEAEADRMKATQKASAASAKVAEMARAEAARLAEATKTEKARIERERADAARQAEAAKQAEATKAAEAEAWAQASASPRRQDLEAFLQQYPQSPFAALARARLGPRPVGASRPSSPQPKLTVIDSTTDGVALGAKFAMGDTVRIMPGARIVLLEERGGTIEIRGPYAGPIAPGVGAQGSTGRILGTRNDASPTGAPSATAARPSDVAEVLRYPTMEGPQTVAVGQAFEVKVALTQAPVTPEVTVTPGASSFVAPDGRLRMQLPAKAEEWRLSVVLAAPNFDVVGREASQEITLQRAGDSSTAVFTLRAKAATGQDKLRATLWHNGTYIASISRDILVQEARAVAQDAKPSRSEGGSTTNSRGPAAPPDLTVHLRYDEPDKLGQGQIILASPHFTPPSRLVIARFETPTGAREWIETKYAEILTLAERIHAAAGDDEKARTDAMREHATPLLAGFGAELYKRFAPEPFKDVLLELDRRLKDIKSIQIFTNNPVLPWELMRPVDRSGKLGDYLAIRHRMARWHVTDDRGQFDSPPQQLVVAELAAMVPRYQGGATLAYQASEMDALRQFPGFKAIGGDRAAMRRLLATPPLGIVHFAGHGLVERPAGRAPRFQIGLEDGPLDLTSWRGLAEGRKDQSPLYFFNACDIGRADTAANFVDGWGPAVLETGAIGFIGGLWPLFDRTASDFSRSFYATLAADTKKGPVLVADALAAVRRRFHEVGDPTYLAYAYYGDVNLRLIVER